MDHQTAPFIGPPTRDQTDIMAEAANITTGDFHAVAMDSAEVDRRFAATMAPTTAPRISAADMDFVRGMLVDG